MMFGGPEVGAKQTWRPPIGTLNSGFSAWNVNSLGVVASACATSAAIDAHDLRRFVDRGAALRVTRTSRGRQHLHALVSSSASAASWIAATWSSE